MEELYTVEAEFNTVFYYPIETLVQLSNPLIATPSTIKDIYSLEEYINGGGGVNLNVFLDNNILTRLVHLAKGNEIQGNEASIKVYRYCCAVMCFFILGNFQIETNIAFYERASKNGHQNAAGDYYHFMIANHIHPMIYAELALGLTDKISDKQIQYTKERTVINVPPESNFAKELNDWKLIYSNLLSAKNTLLNNESDRVAQVKNFMEWLVSGGSTTPGLILFILFLFSPRASNKLGQMIKNINSTDFEKLKEGLKNAAWDLTYLAAWRKKSKSQPESTIWFFCTHDKVLLTIARYFYPKQGEDNDIALKNLINDYWGKSKGTKIYEYYKDLEKAISFNNDARIEHNQKVLSGIDQTIAVLESQLKVRMK
jgi:hypothetical protein